MQGVTPKRRSAIDYLNFFLPRLGIEQMNKVSGKIEIFERLLTISKRPLKESIGILYNYGPGVRKINALCGPRR